MGATREQLDLTREDYGGLEGRCHEALVLNRPDVVEDAHASTLEAGAEVVETDSFQGLRLKLKEWGLGSPSSSTSTGSACRRRRALPSGFIPKGKAPDELIADTERGASPLKPMPRPQPRPRRGQSLPASGLGQ